MCCYSLIMNGIRWLFVLFNIVVLTSKGTCLYCVHKKLSWLNSMQTCVNQTGKPLPYMKGFENIIKTLLQEHDLTENVNIWTANYLTQSGTKAVKLCPFRYMTSITDKGQTFYGDCDASRKYICRNSTTLGWHIEEGNHDQAVESCGTILTSELGSSLGSFKPGYFWLGQAKHAEKITIYEEGKVELQDYALRGSYMCGAYSSEAGPYFRQCDDKILPFCHFLDTPQTSKNWTCFTDSKSTTKSPQVTLNSKTSKTIASTTLKSSDQPTETDFGLEAGMPIGLCLAVICIVILSVFVTRRYKCWNTKKDNNNEDARQQFYKVRQAVAHVNKAYEANADTIIKITKHITNKKSNDMQYANIDCEFDNDGTNDQRKNIEVDQIETMEDYDTAASFKKNNTTTSCNIYNRLQGDEYDSMVNVNTREYCSHVYDSTSGKQTESEYDSTVHVIHSMCDNVSNHVPKNETNYYDSALDSSKHGQYKVTDHTYDKLK